MEGGLHEGGSVGDGVWLDTSEFYSIGRALSLAIGQVGRNRFR